jgi:NADH-quinone oxidoreductase subunit E
MGALVHEGSAAVWDTGPESAEVEKLLAAYAQARENLITILQEVQQRLGYLPAEAVRQVADHLALSESDIYGVASFYSQFRFHPPGRHCLRVCEGTACHVRGSRLLVDAIERELQIPPGQTTPDREFSLESVMCLGSCALAPALVVDGAVHGRMTPKKLDRLLQGVRK